MYTVIIVKKVWTPLRQAASLWKLVGVQKKNEESSAVFFFILLSLFLLFSLVVF